MNYDSGIATKGLGLREHSVVWFPAHRMPSISIIMLNAVLII